MNSYLCTINTLIIHVLAVFLAPRSSILSKCTISKSQDHIGGVSLFLFCFLMACRFDVIPVSQKGPRRVELHYYLGMGMGWVDV